jgi:hypothetical protein
MSHDPVTGLSGAYTPAKPEPIALVDPVTVRALRPHDTADGLKAPGDAYQRERAEAEALADKSIVTIEAAAKAAPRKRKA